MKPFRPIASHYLLAATLLSAAPPVGAENVINVYGSGYAVDNVDNHAAASSLIELYQVGGSYAGGTFNKAGTTATPLTVSGTGNTLRVGQGAVYTCGGNPCADASGGTWVAGTAVTGNEAIITQGGNNNIGAIYQTGNGNSASIGQSGATTALINQSGDYNTATVTGMTGGTLAINQSGSGDIASVSSMSGGSLNVTQSNVSQNLTVSGQSSGSLSVAQTAAGNTMIIASYNGGINGLAITQSATNTTFTPTSSPGGYGGATFSNINPSTLVNPPP